LDTKKVEMIYGRSNKIVGEPGEKKKRW